MANAVERHEIAVAVSALLVRRGGRTILPSISLEIREGAVTGLLGPSGCGKTTLMRAVVGVQVVAGGNVSVFGVPAGHPDLRRRVAYMTQVPSVYPDLTVAENLWFFARVLDVPMRRVDEVVDTVGLVRQRQQVAHTLSGGERSRASLAVALLAQPELLVLDEPTVGLDPSLRGELWQAFHALAHGGVTLLISTHVMDEAARCNDLVLMREGRIVATGAPGALLARTGAADIEGAFLALAAASS
jgi:ABC-2 type transport system ATP-binding protein